MARSPEYPKQVGYQVVCPIREAGRCAIRTVETSTHIISDSVERPPDCFGATCSLDQIEQTCGKPSPPEGDIRSICPRLRIDGCAVVIEIIDEHPIQIDEFPHPECSGAIPPAKDSRDAHGIRRIPAISEYTCGLDAPPPDLQSV